MSENALYLRKGSPVGLPPSGEIAILATSAGVLKQLTSAGTETGFGGVSTLAAGNASISVGGTSTDPTVAQDPGTAVTLVANDTDITIPITASAGNVRINIDISAANPGVISLRPNGLTTNLKNALVYGTAGATGNAGGTTGQVAGSGGTGRITGTIDVTVKAGRIRTFTCNLYDGTFDAAICASVQWTDTATAMTSLVIHCVNAAGFLTGSSAVKVVMGTTA